MAHFPNYLKWISFHLQGITLKSYLRGNYWNCPGRRRLKKKLFVWSHLLLIRFRIHIYYIYIHIISTYTKKKKVFFKTKLGTLCYPLCFLGYLKMRIAPNSIRFSSGFCLKSHDFWGQPKWGKLGPPTLECRMAGEAVCSPPRMLWNFENAEDAKKHGFGKKLLYLQKKNVSYIFQK